jgi:hypothetical protein
MRRRIPVHLYLTIALNGTNVTVRVINPPVLADEPPAIFSQLNVALLAIVLRCDTIGDIVKNAMQCASACVVPS